MILMFIHTCIQQNSKHKDGGKVGLRNLGNTVSYIWFLGVTNLLFPSAYLTDSLWCLHIHAGLRCLCNIIKYVSPCVCESSCSFHSIIVYLVSLFLILWMPALIDPCMPVVSLLALFDLFLRYINYYFCFLVSSFVTKPWETSLFYYVKKCSVVFLLHSFWFFFSIWLCYIIFCYIHCFSGFLFKLSF